MTTKFVEIATTDARLFIKAILELGAQGAKLPDDVGVRKGVLMSTKVEIGEDVLVAESPIVRVLPQEKKKNLKPEVKVEEAKVEEKAPQAKQQKQKPAKQPTQAAVAEGQSDEAGDTPSVD